MRRGAAVLVMLVLALWCAAIASAQTGSRFRPAATGTAGVVATESPAASAAALAALDAGGNAVDAAATAVFAMGVARPQSCGIGGGGFLVYRSRTGAARALDFRETAPAAFREDSLTPPGLHKRFTGHLTVGVPGTVAGMAAALQRYGTFTLAQAMGPGELYARKGVRVTGSLSQAMQANRDRIGLFPSTIRTYLKPDGSAYAEGETLRQPELGATYRRIMREGVGAFYGGEIARAIVRDMRAPRPATKDAGLLTVKDFAGYKAVWRDPIRSTYRERTVIGMPPPSSGGIAIAEMLGILQNFDLTASGQSSADTLHRIIEAQKIAWADRGRFVADPDVIPQPTATLISSGYTKARAAEILPTLARQYAPGPIEPPARPEESTTHISVMDAGGNAVAVTCTVEQEFGSAVVAPGTGILLNNELTDFGNPGTANAPGPGKRPRSSMAPTIVVQPGGRPTLVVGGAGGARIIMGVLNTIVQSVDFDQPIDQALDAPRLDAMNGEGGRVEIEDDRIPEATLAELERRGHKLQRLGEYAIRPRVNAVGMVPARPGVPPEETTGRLAASDPRTDDAAVAQRERGRVPDTAPTAPAPARAGR